MKKLLLTLLCLPLLFSCGDEKKISKFEFKDNSIFGIDVSHYQKKIDWEKVSKNTNPKIQFVYIKASEGVTWKDKRFKYNYKNAKSNNLRVGVYHFFSPSTLGKNQFREIKTIYPKDYNDLPLMIDCEKIGNSKSNYLKELYIMLELCEDYYGSKPVIYSTQRFYNTNLIYKLKDYKLMIGRYNNKKNEPNLIDNRKWDIWQFTEKGNINGISEYVDIDVAKEQFWINEETID